MTRTALHGMKIPFAFNLRRMQYGLPQSTNSRIHVIRAPKHRIAIFEFLKSGSLRTLLNFQYTFLISVSAHRNKIIGGQF